MTVFEVVVHRLVEARDAGGDRLRMDSLICSDNDGTQSHEFGDATVTNLRSIAKPIVALALGAAIDKGISFGGVKLSLETPVWQFLSQYAEIRTPATLRAWTTVVLRDLLRVTLGHDKGLLFSKDIQGRNPDTFVDYIVNYPVTGQVGVQFTYSNAGTFLLSSMVTECLGVSLSSFVDEFLFRPLKISRYRWDEYGKYCAGCTGLWMSNEDLHRIGRLLLGGGVLDGTAVVPEDFVVDMHTPQVPAPTHRYIADRAFPKWSYGLNLWICEDGNYYCDGTDGQYMIVIPRHRRVITATGHQTDTVPVSEALGLFK